MSSDSPIAVFGATGPQGGAVAHAILGAGRPVRALARTPEKAAALAEAGAEVVHADLSDPRTIKAALRGASGAFVVIPFAVDPPAHAAYVQSALGGLRAAGAPPAVFTLSGPVPAEDTGAAAFDARRAAEEAVRKSGLPVAMFTPGGYLGNFLGPWAAPAVVHEGQIPYPLPSSHRQPWISVEDQAALALAALDRDDFADTLAGRTFAVGRDLSGAEIAAGISEALGKPVRWLALDPADFGAALVPVMGEAAAEMLADDYRLMAGRPEAAGLRPDLGAAPRKLGVPLTPVAEWARSQDWEAAAAVGAQAA